MTEAAGSTRIWLLAPLRSLPPGVAGLPDGRVRRGRRLLGAQSSSRRRADVEPGRPTLTVVASSSSSYSDRWTSSSRSVGEGPNPIPVTADTQTLP